MNIIPTAIADVLLIEPRVFGDARGFFFESFNQQAFHAATGTDVHFVQDNHSRSARGVLRGLHYQLPPHAQGKLVRVVRGSVWDVAVDVRRGSPTFGRFEAVELSEENRKQFYVPEGFAHGFRVLTDIADFHYKCTDFYAPGDEYGILWNDPSLAIPWDDPAAPVVSPKDQLLPRLAEVSPDNLPEFTKLKDVGLQ